MVLKPRTAHQCSYVCNQLRSYYVVVPTRDAIAYVLLIIIIHCLIILLLLYLVY